MVEKDPHSVHRPPSTFPSGKKLQSMIRGGIHQQRKLVPCESQSSHPGWPWQTHREQGLSAREEKPGRRQTGRAVEKTPSKSTANSSFAETAGCSPDSQRREDSGPPEPRGRMTISGCVNLTQWPWRLLPEGCRERLRHLPAALLRHWNSQKVVRRARCRRKDAG